MRTGATVNIIESLKADIEATKLVCWSGLVDPIRVLLNQVTIMEALTGLLKPSTAEDGWECFDCKMINLSARNYCGQCGCSKTKEHNG